ncbi:hypothetical protein [Gemmiger formicilis]|uniref:hypothetical protein n=1 Tax=Gemmiger formicilis TaxID=745368 RepID=UPI001179BD1C|nr:hypothetical protein [Gemmiger formicilis]
MCGVLGWVFVRYTVGGFLGAGQLFSGVCVGSFSLWDPVLVSRVDHLLAVLRAAGVAALGAAVLRVGVWLVGRIRYGDVVGAVPVCVQGGVLGAADLLAGRGVSGLHFFFSLLGVGVFFSSIYLPVVVALMLLVVVCYGVCLGGGVLFASGNFG